MKKTRQTIKQFWLYIGKKDQVINISNEIDNKLLADTFNEFCTTLGSKLAENFNNLPADDSAQVQLSYPHIFEIELLSVEDVAEYIKAILPSNGCGMDVITAKL